MKATWSTVRDRDSMVDWLLAEAKRGAPGSCPISRAAAERIADWNLDDPNCPEWLSRRWNSMLESMSGQIKASWEYFFGSVQLSISLPEQSYCRESVDDLTPHIEQLAECDVRPDGQWQSLCGDGISAFRTTLHRHGDPVGYLQISKRNSDSDTLVHLIESANMETI